MNARKELVLDANILIRAALGIRVLSLLKTYEDSTAFHAPDVCFEDARKYVPRVLSGRGRDPGIGLAVLAQIELLVQVVDQVAYRDFEQVGRERVAVRDIQDWPIAAAAIMLNAPIWTEDQDFFGSGIATWTTDRVEIYLKRP